MQSKETIKQHLQELENQQQEVEAEFNELEEDCGADTEMIEANHNMEVTLEVISAKINLLKWILNEKS